MSSSITTIPGVQQSVTIWNGVSVMTALGLLEAILCFTIIRTVFMRMGTVIEKIKFGEQMEPMLNIFVLFLGLWAITIIPIAMTKEVPYKF